MATTLNLSGIANPKKDVLVIGVYTEPMGYISNGCRGTYEWPQYSEPYYGFMKWKSLVEQNHPEVTIKSGDVTYDLINKTSDLKSVVFEDYKMIYLPGQKTVAQCSPLLSFTLCPFLEVLYNRRADVERYTNENRGSIFALEQSTEP